MITEAASIAKDNCVGKPSVALWEKERFYLECAVGGAHSQRLETYFSLRIMHWPLSLSSRVLKLSMCVLRY